MANIKKINVGGTDYNIIDSRIPGIDTTPTSGSANVVTSGGVYAAIESLPEPMIFKGSLGTGGTITTLPAASSANEGFTYKVITAGTYQSIAAKVGDTFISTGSAWVLIPSGDEPSGTVTSITLNATSPIAIDSTAAITTSGTRTLSHATSGVSAGTYKSVTVNSTGHVTAGTNPTTLSGYGITDAKIENGTVTLGSNSLSPILPNGEGATSGHIATFESDNVIQDSGKTLGDYVQKAGDTMSGALNISLPRSTSITPLDLFTADMNAGDFNVFRIGKSASKGNAGQLIYKYAGDDNSGNTVHVGFYDNYTILNIRNDKRVGINNATPATALDVTGDIQATGDIRAKGNDLYIGSASNSQCHQQYDATNKCLKFIFD